MMKCPRCWGDSKVLDTRKGFHDEVQRRRECENGHRFLTMEKAISLKVKDNQSLLDKLLKFAK